MAITKGTKKLDLAYKFINIALDPQIQSQVGNMQKASPVVAGATLDPEAAKLPGIFTTSEQWARARCPEATRCAPNTSASGTSGSLKTS